MASLFWVGGASTWNGTAGTKWATSSGGAGGAAIPTAADDVFLDASSGANTVTLSAAAVARSINCTGFTGTLSHPSATNVSIGDGTAGASNIALKLVSGMTYTVSGGASSALTFASTSTTAQTIDFGGKTTGNVTYNGAAGSWQLISGHTIAATSSVTLTNGTLDTNGQSISWGSFSLGAGTKTLTLGASAVTITATTSTVWNLGTNASGFTFNSGTSGITFNANASVTASLGAQTYYDVSITGSGSFTITGGATFHNLTRTSNINGSQALVIQNDIVVNNVFSCIGTYSGTQAVRIVLSPSLITNIGTQRQITVNGSYSFTNVDFNFIKPAGTATLPWTGTGMGDGEGNSNITFDTPRTLYWVGNATNWVTLARWSLSSGGASATTAPLPQDDCIIDSNSGVSASGTFNTGLRFMGRNIDFTGMPNAATTTFNLGGFNPGIGGSLTWAAGMTLSTGTAATINFIHGSRSVTLTNNGCTYGANWSLRNGGVGGGLSLGDDLVMNSNAIYTFDGGTFNANNKNFTAGVFTSSNTNTRTVTMGSGTWTIAGTSGIIWNYGTTTGLTHNGNTSTLIFSDTGASQKQMNSGSGNRVWYNLQLASSTGGFLFNNANFICNDFTVAAPNTITVVAGQTITVNGIFTAKGTAGNLITWLSTAAGSQFTFSKSSGVVNCDYLSLKDSSATGGATWYAGPNSTNVSGNSGWIFTAAQMAIQKSLTYSVKVGNSITKSLGYSIKMNPSITKSLKYTVKTSQSITRSLRYTVKKTPSLTKSLQYAIKQSIPITKSLQYYIPSVAVPHSITKILEYTTRSGGGGGTATFGKTTDGATNSASSVDKMFVSQFTATSSGTLTKLTARMWLSSSGSTTVKAAVYADSSGSPGALLATGDAVTLTNTTEQAIDLPVSGGNQIAITNGTAYWLGPAWADPGSPSVTVSKDATASQRQEQTLSSGWSTLPNPFGTPSATNSGPIDVYATITTSGGAVQVEIKKTLQYAIKAPAALTKSLKYTIKQTPAALTKSLKYTIKVTPAAITKSLRYAIKSNVAITKSLKYTIKAPVAITKSLKYTIKATPAALTKSLKYTIRTTPTALTKSLQYVIVGGKTTIQITKSLKYTIKRPATAITKSLQYTVKRTPAALTKSLQYTIKRPATALTKSLQYTIRRTPGAVTKSLQYTVRRTQTAITKSLKYTIKAPAALTESLKYTVRKTPSAVTKSLKYTIVKSYIVTKILAYDIKAPKSLTKSLAYRVKAPASPKSLTLRYILTGTPIPTSIIPIADVPHITYLGVQEAETLTHLSTNETITILG